MNALSPTIPDLDHLESLDYPWLCVELDLHPKLVRAWASKVKDRDDEDGIEAEIRTGLHRLDPAFDDVAYIVARAFLLDQGSMRV
jgi:hypothetical protein